MGQRFSVDLPCTTSNVGFTPKTREHMRNMSLRSGTVGGPTIVTRKTNIPFSSEEESSESEIVEEVPSLTPNQLLGTYARPVPSPGDGGCSICMCDLSDNSGFSEEEDDESGKEVCELCLCGHTFHLACLQQMIGVSLSHVECPVCKKIYGVKMGNQPEGIMEVMETFETLPGYSGCGTIVITYYFRGGIQGPEHPEPGCPYRAFAFPRQAYLPNNEKGKKVLKLLKESWRRRLTFTIGTSVTTGMKNVITWNEIHHKTSFSNFGGHGYPDPSYLDNVTMELALQGVTEESMENQALVLQSITEQSMEDQALPLQATTEQSIKNLA